MRANLNYKQASSLKRNRVILFGLRDVGSANACLPVISMLKSKGVPLSVYAEGSAFGRFKDKFPFIPECKMDDLLDSVNPSLVVATTAILGGAIPIDLINTAKQRNLAVVLIEDVWASHSASKWTALPDSVCVMDEIGKNLIRQSWPEYQESKIHVTGMPTFDKYFNFKNEPAKKKLRETLGLHNDWLVIFFPGQLWGMTQSVPMLVEALNGMDSPVHLILKDRPAFLNKPNKYIHIYDEYYRALKKLKNGVLINANKLTSDEVCAGSDIVVGLYSTMTVEACYMNKPVIVIWSPEISQSLFKATNKTLRGWPIVDLGAALIAYNPKEIRNCLERIISGDTIEMLEVQRKHFKADGLSAERIAKVIMSYYKKRL